ncbi:hypothetical protein [Vibrio genomosp. F10]|uniref:hypothetical protein n=1 Tax=Vibrio genomosp. F10 TaxID=723171 RepID=UPI000319A346|nr:hypothetical protein [Vibrio genomosp. F10]OEF09547.1 hypothetical protein A1QI_13940 [Vibrio genomosp. F10 str. 9ZB36]
MSYYIVEKNRIILSGDLITLEVDKDCFDLDYFEIEPEEIFNLLDIRLDIYHLDLQSYLFKDGKPCSGNHLIENNDRPIVLNLTEQTLYDPFFVFTAINGKKYYVQDIYLCDLELYRVLNLTKEELLRLWLHVEKGQIFDDFIQDALSRNAYDVEKEIALSRITNVPPEGAIHIDDEFFELLESGDYQEFLEEVLEIDLIQEITNPKAA